VETLQAFKYSHQAALGQSHLAVKPSRLLSLAVVVAVVAHEV
jgi:hypothetical protein